MADSIDSAAIRAVGDLSPPQEPLTTPKGRLLAALFSALIPGTGQLLLGEWSLGIALSVTFACLIGSLWAFRLLSSLVGMGFVVLAWFSLTLYAVLAAMFKLGLVGRLSAWWALAVPLLSYMGFNLIFTPLFLLSGFRALKFESSAMEPTLLVGDQFVADSHYYRSHSPRRNDLVVIRRSDYQTVKRVIAVGGDTVEEKDQQVFLNGQLEQEPFVQHQFALGTHPEMDSFEALTVPQGKYFLMGDNRDISLDSRTFGLLDDKAIVGKPLYIYRSPTKGRVGKQLQ